MSQVHFRNTPSIVVPGSAGAAGTTGLPGTDSIGMGYNVFTGAYATPNSTTNQLFSLGEWEELELSEGVFLKPKAVHVQTLQQGGVVRSEGKTSREYQASVATKAGMKGSYGFFSGSLSVEFTSNERRCTTYSFVSQTDRFHKYLLTLAPDQSLADLVRPNVRTDLDTMPPDQLFDTYGTHYLESLIIGATSVYSSATNTSEYSSKIDIKTALELQYKVLTKSLSGNLSTEQKTAISSLNSSSHLEIFVQGGQAELAHTIFDGSYQQWIDSIGRNMAFIGLNQNSLQPIWSLCNGTRRDQLAAAYETYAHRHPPELPPDIVRIHHFSTNVTKSRHYHSQHVDDYPDKDWQLDDGRFKFYAYMNPGEGRIPIYIHQSLKNDPKRFKLSPQQKIGHGWADSTKIAFYAYPDRGDDRVAVFGFTSNDDSSHHGWLYTTDEGVAKWSRNETTFYAPKVK